MDTSNNGWVERSVDLNSDPPALGTHQTQLLTTLDHWEGFDDYSNAFVDAQSFQPPTHGLDFISEQRIDSSTSYEEPSWGAIGCYNLPDAAPSLDIPRQRSPPNDRTADHQNQWLSDDGSEDDEDESDGARNRASRKSFRRPHGEIKMINGELHQCEPGWEVFEPAIFHTDLRAHLIYEASCGGELRYGRRRAKGAEVTNVTSYLAENQNWDEDRDHRPEVCFQYEKREWITPDYEPEIWTHHRKFVIDHCNRRMRLWHNLPLTISSEESGMFLEAWRRQDSRIAIDDMMARMPREFLKGTKRREIYSLSAINMRMNRFRINACIKSWNLRTGTPTIDAYLDYLLPNECHAANSTRGFRDLTKAESLIAWEVNKGSRHCTSSDITDKERTKRMNAIDRRIKKLIEQDHQRGIMTVYMTRDDLADRVGTLHIPRVTTGIYKSKRKAMEDISEEKAGEETRPQPKRQKSIRPNPVSTSLLDVVTRRPNPVKTPPVPPFDASVSQPEHDALPDFETMDFPPFESFAYPPNCDIGMESIQKWLEDNPTMQVVENSSIYPTSTSASHPYQLTSPYTHSSASVPLTHKPETANEVRAVFKALESTRRHIKSFFALPIRLPKFNPNESYSKQKSQLLDYFRDLWVDAYGKESVVPELDAKMPEL